MIKNRISLAGADSWCRCVWLFLECFCYSFECLIAHNVYTCDLHPAPNYTSIAGVDRVRSNISMAAIKSKL